MLTNLRPLRRAAVPALLVAVACGGGPSAQTIDREDFISTYVDLRMAAIDTDSTRLAPVQRDEILSRHGVSEDDLVTFADVHASEMEFMRDVWTEVETRLDRQVGEAEDPGADGA